MFDDVTFHKPTHLMTSSSRLGSPVSGFGFCAYWGSGFRVLGFGFLVLGWAWAWQIFRHLKDVEVEDFEDVKSGSKYVFVSHRPSPFPLPLLLKTLNIIEPDKNSPLTRILTPQSEPTKGCNLRMRHYQPEPEIVNLLNP